MVGDLVGLLATSLRDAFLQVGVWVALMLFVFGAVESWTGGAVIDFLRRRRRLQPLAGALLGVLPGCGGAIFVMPLFVHGTISFGAVIATLVATMGDSSWVILAAAPRVGVLVHAILFVCGVVTGYAVDAAGIGASLLRRHRSAAPPPVQTEALPKAFREPGYRHVEPVELAARLHRETHVQPTRLGYRFTHRFYPVLWGFFLVGFVVSFFVQLQIVQPEGLDAALGGLPVYTVVGVLGGLVSLAWFVVIRRFAEIESHEAVEQSLQSFREMLIHSGAEAAQVTVWVTVAYFLFQAVLQLTGWDLGAVVARSGIVSVWAAAAVGLIPGCGPQILLTGLYIKGYVPFAALLANALSQDGDALFPLLSLDRPSALAATVWTTIPALIIGSLLYLLL